MHQVRHRIAIYLLTDFLVHQWNSARSVLTLNQVCLCSKQPYTRVPWVNKENTGPANKLLTSTYIQGHELGHIHSTEQKKMMDFKSKWKARKIEKTCWERVIGKRKHLAWIIIEGPKKSAKLENKAQAFETQTIWKIIFQHKKNKSSLKSRWKIMNLEKTCWETMVARRKIDKLNHSLQGLMGSHGLENKVHWEKIALTRSRWKQD